jgi:hypothetical protein
LGMSDFDGMLEIQIPRLRRYARALTWDFSQSRSKKKGFMLNGLVGLSGAT